MLCCAVQCSAMCYALRCAVMKCSAVQYKLSEGTGSKGTWVVGDLEEVHMRAAGICSLTEE